MIQSADNSCFPPRRAANRLGSTLALLGLFLSGQPLRAAEPPVAVELHRPSVEFQAILDLFSKTSVGPPAAALAAWKNGPRGDNSLGKGTEAVIALFNPRMTAELKGLDQGRLSLAFGTKPGRPNWRLTLPNDDGSFEAFASALALTDGATVEPIQEHPVRRLGKEGSSLAIADGRRVAYASDREQLRAALADLESPPKPLPSGPGIAFRIRPGALGDLGSLNARRIQAALDSARLTEIEGRLHVEDDAIEADWVAKRKPDVPLSRNQFSTKWLEGLPAVGTLAAFASPIDTAPNSLKYLFEIADRIEKADPSRAETAPFRVRLNLLAIAVGVRPETEIWPLLGGISGAISLDDRGEIKSVVIGLHAVDPASAEALASTTLPKLLKFKTGETKGRISGKTVAFEPRGSSIWIGYGDNALADALEVLAGTKPSVGRIIAPALNDKSPRRIAALWPGQIPEPPTWGTSLSKAMEESPPLIWSSDTEATEVRDHLAWGGLRDTIKRWIDSLSLVPPSDRSPVR